MRLTLGVVMLAISAVRYGGMSPEWWLAKLHNLRHGEPLSVLRIG